MGVFRREALKNTVTPKMALLKIDFSLYFSVMGSKIYRQGFQHPDGIRDFRAMQRWAIPSRLSSDHSLVRRKAAIDSGKNTLLFQFVMSYSGVLPDIPGTGPNHSHSIVAGGLPDMS